MYFAAIEVGRPHHETIEADEHRQRFGHAIAFSPAPALGSSNLERGQTF